MDDARDPATFARLVNEQIEPLADIPELQVDYGQLVDLTVKQQYEDLRQLFHRQVSSSPDRFSTRVC